jgi:hypothetical protein
MSYIGRGLQSGAFRQLDDISSGFDGSDTTHTMQVNSTNVTVGDVNQILLSLGGVIQKPGTDFTVSSSTLTFTTAPAANTSFFAILLGSDNGGTVTPSDNSVTDSKIPSTGAFTIGAAGTASNLAGIPFFQGDTGSIYTHDVSGTDSTAQYNTSYGLTALDAITTGDDNVALGFNAAGALTTGGNNVAIGSNAMYEGAVTGSYNVAIGGSALRKLTDGPSNVAIGVNSLEALTTGDRNIAIGMSSSTGYDTENDNLAIGHSALGGSVAGGELNVAIGNYALDALTSGDHNICIGYNAGSAMTTMGQSVCIGSSAGTALTTGATAQNIMIGYATGFNLTSEGHNTFVGRVADGTGTTNGCEYNSGFGNYVLQDLTTGDQNACFGDFSGYNVSTGYGNTFIGAVSGEDCTVGNHNICVGNDADLSANNESNAIVIGQNIAGSGNDFSFGKSGNVVTNDFDVDANWSRSSDVRKKRNIHSQGLGLDFINDLRTVRFQWKPSNEFPKEWNDYSEENNMNLDAIMHGFIAQEVKEALDKHASDDDKKFSGWKEGEDGMQHTSREMFVIPLIKAVQELSAQVEELKEKLKEA